MTLTTRSAVTVVNECLPNVEDEFEFSPLWDTQPVQVTDDAVVGLLPSRADSETDVQLHSSRTALEEINLYNF